MGFLTTITIRNDGLDAIRDNKDEFMENLLKACSGGGIYYRYPHNEFGVGYCANPVIVQSPRHADSHTIYVHMGNTLVEMNPYSEETKDIVERHPKFFDELLRFMEDEVRELKRLKKEREKDGNK